MPAFNAADRDVVQLQKEAGFLTITSVFHAIALGDLMLLS
jgi:hypothetical protein